jgi:hypothetical protein
MATAKAKAKAMAMAMMTATSGVAVTSGPHGGLGCGGSKRV